MASQVVGGGSDCRGQDLEERRERKKERGKKREKRKKKKRKKRKKTMKDKRRRGEDGFIGGSVKGPMAAALSMATHLEGGRRRRERKRKGKKKIE